MRVCVSVCVCVCVCERARERERERERESREVTLKGINKGFWGPDACDACFQSQMPGRCPER